MQVCPVAAKMPETAPLTAASKSASAKTTLGDLPPSSRLTCLKSRAAAWLMWRPVASEPVKVIFRTRGCSTRAAPTSWPNPVTTLTTPGGSPASWKSRTSSRVEAEVNSDGLITTVQPAARTGAIFQASNNNGEFHGVMTATTPTGSFFV